MGSPPINTPPTPQPPPLPFSPIPFPLSHLRFVVFVVGGDSCSSRPAAGVGGFFRRQISVFFRSCRSSLWKFLWWPVGYKPARKMTNPKQTFCPRKRKSTNNRSSMPPRFHSKRMNDIEKDIVRSKRLTQCRMGTRNSNENNKKGMAKIALKTSNQRVESSIDGRVEMLKNSRKKSISTTTKCSKQFANNASKLGDARLNADDGKNVELPSASFGMRLLSSKQHCKNDIAPAAREIRGNAHAEKRKGKEMKDLPNKLGKISHSMHGVGMRLLSSSKQHCKNDITPAMREIRGNIHAEKRKGKEMQDLSNNLGKNSHSMHGVDPSREQGGTVCIVNNTDTILALKDIAQRKIPKRNSVGFMRRDGIQNPSLFVEDNNDGRMSTGKRTEPTQYKCKTNDNEGNEALEKLTSNDSMLKKRRRYIANEDEEDDSGQCYLHVSSGVSSISTTISEAIKGYCSLPIDEPIWSGIFKIESKEYVSLAGHLSTKSSEKVCRLSKCFFPVVEVTKHSRLEFWPMSLEISGPTDENIGMFLLPNNARPDEKLHQLVKEVMKNDLALRAVIGEDEMLIFPSILLPHQYQTFKGRHYLWGMFRPRKDIVDGLEPHAMPSDIHEGFQDGTGQSEDNHVPEQNMDTELLDPEGAKMQDVADQISSPALSLSNAPCVNEPSMTATVPANQELTNSSLEVLPGRMFVFVAQPSPRMEQLIQEMKREGALIFEMPRVTATTTE